MEFRDAASLRDGLQRILETPERPKPVAAAKVAFAYTGEGSHWVGMGQALYQCEPVVAGGSGSLRCDAAGRTGGFAARGHVRPVRCRAGSGCLGVDAAGPFTALECALAALWSSLGIRPGVSVRARVWESLRQRKPQESFGLEEGLRLAAARGAGQPSGRHRGVATVRLPW